jgi:hypothetical protein
MQLSDGRQAVAAVPNQYLRSATFDQNTSFADLGGTAAFARSSHSLGVKPSGSFAP